MEEIADDTEDYTFEDALTPAPEEATVFGVMPTPIAIAADPFAAVTPVFDQTETDWSIGQPSEPEDPFGGTTAVSSEVADPFGELDNQESAIAGGEFFAEVYAEDPDLMGEGYTASYETYDEGDLGAGISFPEDSDLADVPAYPEAGLMDGGYAESYETYDEGDLGADIPFPEDPNLMDGGYAESYEPYNEGELGADIPFPEDPNLAEADAAYLENYLAETTAYPEAGLMGDGYAESYEPMTKGSLGQTFPFLKTPTCRKSRPIPKPG
ncbi:MAG: hypothetical protein HC918_13110 [Oscillatoriales cyanobacterium SM2_1_8]|nr:hypothetical protein [Oscillatoriales cyanobacterium SM2_1_8]